MKVIENFEVPQVILDRLRRREFQSGRYIVSRLLCCPRKTYFERAGIKPIVSDDTQLLFARGRAHHSVLEVYRLTEVERKKDSEVKNQRGEIIPIYGHIDMIGDRITEIFTTSISSRKIVVPEDAARTFPLKVKQLTAYCHFETESMGDLLVFFLFGDYSRFTEISGEKKYVGIRPQLRCFTYEFEEENRLKIWKHMNANLGEIEYGLQRKRMPLLAGEEWECNNCGWNHICYGDEPIEARDPDKLVTQAMRSGID